MFERVVLSFNLTQPRVYYSLSFKKKNFIPNNISYVLDLIRVYLFINQHRYNMTIIDPVQVSYFARLMLRKASVKF